jgi:L-aminopeptidase/D-esterase-like protein
MNPSSNQTLSAVPGVTVGHAEVAGGESGCTVILGPFRGVVEVRGLATGTRELGTLESTHLVSVVDAILLSGGSAFGLAAAEGVVEWLETRGQGFDAGVARVPIVPAAVIFDLGEDRARPGRREGRAACEAAMSAGPSEPVATGRVGAGAGATVGKMGGPALAVPGGLGTATVAAGRWTVGAMAVVNCVGAVLGPDGAVVAGPRGEDGAWMDSETLLLDGLKDGPTPGGGGGPLPGANTTLAVVATDAPLGKADLARLARLASTAFARTIVPVHTPFDGDVLFALSTGNLEGEPGPVDSRIVMALGIAARDALEHSILGAVSA